MERVESVVIENKTRVRWNSKSSKSRTENVSIDFIGMKALGPWCLLVVGQGGRDWTGVRSEWEVRTCREQVCVGRGWLSAMALPKDSWMGEEVSWLPAVREQTLHVALGVGTTGET